MAPSKSYPRGTGSCLRRDLQKQWIRDPWPETEGPKHESRLGSVYSGRITGNPEVESRVLKYQTNCGFEDSFPGGYPNLKPIVSAAARR
jgi:hypothetical protein